MRAILIAVFALAISACALQPMYGGGTSGPVASVLRQVTVATIPGRDGWLVYNKLKDRLGEAGAAAPAYRLEVELDDNITGFGIRGDRAATRERRTLRARYRLVDAASGLVVVDSTAGSDAGIDVVSSQYATVAAEQSALERLAAVVADQIVGRLAQYMTSRPAQP